jgi:hypothetical protein
LEQVLLQEQQLVCLELVLVSLSLDSLFYISYD